MTAVNKAGNSRCHRDTVTAVSWGTAMCFYTSEFRRLRKVLSWRECPPDALEMTNPEMTPSSNRWRIAQPTLGNVIYLAYISGFFMNLDSSHF